MKKILLSFFAFASFSATGAMAANLEIEITNLTNGMYFTPLLVSAHNKHTGLFELGTPASAELQAMAEGGDISGLEADQMALASNTVANPAGGLLAPGATAMTDLRTSWRNRWLSIVGMLLPTNDGFVGMESIRIPNKPGTYTYYINGYDAGTEANDEIINGGGAPGTPGIPADPGMNSGTGATGVTMTENNMMVHIHRGALGDNDLAGGDSDLDSSVHHWLNPVAKVVIHVKRKNRW